MPPPPPPFVNRMLFVIFEFSRFYGIEMTMATLSKMKLSKDHVLKGLDELRNQELLCDVHLVADGAKFPAHRVVLAAASPYFQAMFTGGFKENQMNEITLNDMSSQGLKCVLDAIYTPELLLSKENVCDVLPVASQWQLNVKLLSIVEDSFPEMLLHKRAYPSFLLLRNTIFRKL